MKKFVAVMITIVMMLSFALAECRCSVSETEKRLIYDVCAIENIVITRQETDIIYAIITDSDAIECREARKTVMRVVLVNYETIKASFTEIQMELLIGYITKCCCEDVALSATTDNSTVMPSTTPMPRCNHTGGTHENGGKCTKCGYTYQDHTIGEWESRDGTWHYHFCSCGVKVETEYHQFDGQVYGRNGSMVKRYCVICKQYSWVYDRSESHNCGCADCSGCCEDCTCGCH